MRSDEDQKTATLGGILAEESHGTPGKALVEGISGATARPAPAKFPPPLECSCQPDQLGRHLRGNIQLSG